MPHLHLRPLAAAVLLAGLPACIPFVGDLPADGDLAEECGASGYRNLIGRERAAAEELMTVQPKRVYGPDEAVTMDYQPDRVNFVIGADGTIEEVRCG
jgi:hypothetical protein